MTWLDGASRAAASTDNSVYQIVPDLVVCPRDTGEVVQLLTLLAKPAYWDIPVSGRGHGTGTNGQCLNRGVVVDFRRHMHRLLAMNAAEGWADVDPGIVLDELNEQLKPTGLFLAPDTSTSNRCRVGGLVSTDAPEKP